jgi:riboflavin kinase/FMN adenylyltransferase
VRHTRSTHGNDPDVVQSALSSAARLVAIGNFDGVHRGHQALLGGAAREAALEGLAPSVLTFAPHPAEALGRTPPPVLTRPSRKRELVGRLFPSVEVLEQRFDTAFAAQSPETFASWLATELRAARVVVGKNFRFGKGFGFRASSQEVVGDGGGGFSSTRIRAAVAAGDLADAERMLGRPHMLIGEVVRGKQLGRTIGVPTANLDRVLEMLPPLGIYATLIDREGPDGTRALGLGATSIGKNPTTDEGDAVKVEVHVLDFDGDLYGSTLRVSLIARLRGEEKFESLDALVEQMRRDVADARAALAGRRIDPVTECFN